MDSPAWLILVYKLPAEPTRLRASVWREIRKLGGVYLQDGVCLLPAVLDMDLNAESLRERTVELGGTAWLFEAAPPVGGAHEQLVSLFDGARAEEYAPVLEGVTRITRHMERAVDHWDLSASELDALRAELSKLRTQSTQIRARDHFGSAAGRRIDSLIDDCSEQLAGRGDTA